MPVLPDVLEPVWMLFRQLSGRRQNGALGPGPLQYQEIAAFAALTGQPVSPLEVELLVELDDTWLRYQHYSAASATEQAALEREWADLFDEESGG